VSVHRFHSGLAALTSAPGVAGADRPSGVTLRTVVLGLVLVVGFAFFIPYLSDVRDGPDLGIRPINGASVLALLLVLGPSHPPTAPEVTLGAIARVLPWEPWAASGARAAIALWRGDTRTGGRLPLSAPRTGHPVPLKNRPSQRCQRLLVPVAASQADPEEQR
jgi:hypothetical protein